MQDAQGPPPLQCGRRGGPGMRDVPLRDRPQVGCVQHGCWIGACGLKSVGGFDKIHGVFTLMKHKTILFFVSLDRSCFNEQLGGIFRCPHAKDWHVQVVSDAFSRAEILKTLEFWKPAGVIVECGDALKVSPTLFSGIPTVFVDIGRRRPPCDFSSVGFDS